jgi:GTP-binding protein
MSKIKLAIIGRPNVGKSTLLNRLAEKRHAIVGEKAGITRDRNYIDFDWEDQSFTIIDTGGITFDNEDGFADEIKRQAMIAIEEADAIIFLTDISTGITAQDDQVANILRRNCTKPVYVAANKSDSPEREQMVFEFYGLGFENVYAISALHGSQGLSQMLSDICSTFKSEPRSDTKEDFIRVAIVGKPNVGKSSLFNKLLGEDRSIVSNISGTTRDSINTKLKRHGLNFELIDTAGLRRKSKVREEIERFSNIRTTFSIAACDVAVLIIDATDEEIITDQDQKIASLIENKGKACVVLINKWDLVDSEIKENNVKLEKFKKELDHKLRFIDYAPKEFISAITGKRTDKVWELIDQVNQEHKKKLSTNILNKVISDISVFQPPPVVRQKALKMKFATQVGVAPPEFVLFTNYPELVPESYKRFLENQFRQYFGFNGTPIRINFKAEDKQTQV